MTFVEKISSSFSDLLSFSNKAGRMDYLGGSIVIIILCVIFRGIISSIFFNLNLQSSFFFYLPFILTLTLYVYLQLANTCRRLNDLKKEKILAILVIIPIINLIFQLYLLFAPSKND
jgi:uncharacterized membrane protein YhaH (DUF805 family)|tara:strand:- start:141 stop:491 length:351 start_codon:yes stop_codon:yes gene_type:complete